MPCLLPRQPIACAEACGEHCIPRRLARCPQQGCPRAGLARGRGAGSACQVRTRTKSLLHKQRGERRQAPGIRGCRKAGYAAGRAGARVSSSVAKEALRRLTQKEPRLAGRD